uniref:Uncharacterized protein n=1 Tax=Ascaris lumbricoides TaxID=6252 RepID=A0A0M3IGI2_ASCLU
MRLMEVISGTIKRIANSRTDSGNDAANCSRGTVTRAFVFSWLNKEHKKAGGIGLQAALNNIIGCSGVDVLPPEATITEARPDENERLEAVPISAHTVQPSDNLPKLAKQTTPQEHANATGKVRHLIRHRIASCLKCGLATQPTNKRLGYSSRQFIIITNIVGKGPSKGRGYLILYGALHIRASLFREPFTIII